MKIGDTVNYVYGTEEVGAALLGKIVKKVFISPSGDYIRFVTNVDDVFALGSGDCCSVSWINNITGIHNLIGQMVVEIRVKNEGLIEKPNTTDNDQEEMSYYALTLITEKGFCDIEFRNSSNGCYGGDLALCSPVSSCTKEVTEDF